MSRKRQYKTADELKKARRVQALQSYYRRKALKLAKAAEETFGTGESPVEIKVTARSKRLGEINETVQFERTPRGFRVTMVTKNTPTIGTAANIVDLAAQTDLAEKMESQVAKCFSDEDDL